MTAEEWRPVVGYEGLYEVSDLGRVRSFRSGRAHVMSQTQSGQNPYLCVSLRDHDGRRKTRTVHSLVAEAFIGPRPSNWETRHLDGRKHNNSAANLRYGTRTQNALDRRTHGGDYNVNKTHCPHGHEYTPENTYVYGPRRRSCRTCRRARGRIQDQKRAALRRAEKAAKKEAA